MNKNVFYVLSFFITFDYLKMNEINFFQECVVEVKFLGKSMQSMQIMKFNKSFLTQ